MKKILFITVLLLVFHPAVKSQQIYLGLGKINSAFDYKNSLGLEPPNMQSVYYHSIAIGFRTEFFTPNLFMNFGATYNGYGAVSSDDVTHDFFKWDLTYLGAEIGFDLSIVRFNSFSVLLKASAAAEFLVHGTENYNNQIINLIGYEDFADPMFFYRGGIGFQYDISDRLAVFTNYMYGNSTSFEKKPEKLNIVTHDVKLGLLVNLFKKRAITRSDNSIEKNIENISLRLAEVENDSVKINNNTHEINKLKEAHNKEQVPKNTVYENLAKELSFLDVRFYNIKVRNGKIYVPISTDMLFVDGGWVLSQLGRKVIWSVGNVLAKHASMKSLIESYTRDNLYVGGYAVNDNMNLSVKRAIAIIEALNNNPNVNLDNIDIVGYGNHSPNDNLSGDSRTELNHDMVFILTPNPERFK